MRSVILYLPPGMVVDKAWTDEARQASAEARRANARGRRADAAMHGQGGPREHSGKWHGQMKQDMWLQRDNPKFTGAGGARMQSNLVSAGTPVKMSVAENGTTHFEHGDTGEYLGHSYKEGSPTESDEHVAGRLLR